MLKMFDSDSASIDLNERDTSIALTPVQQDWCPRPDLLSMDLLEAQRRPFRQVWCGDWTWLSMISNCLDSSSALLTEKPWSMESE